MCGQATLHLSIKKKKKKKCQTRVKQKVENIKGIKENRGVN